jgi:hypothetical protein
VKVKVVREMGDSGKKEHGFLRRLPGSDGSSVLLRKGWSRYAGWEVSTF